MRQFCLFLLILGAFASAQTKTAARLYDKINANIDPERIRQHVRFLSHDLLEGRGTGQRGGDVSA